MKLSIRALARQKIAEGELGIRLYRLSERLAAEAGESGGGRSCSSIKPVQIFGIVKCKDFSMGKASHVGNTNKIIGPHFCLIAALAVGCLGFGYIAFSSDRRVLPSAELLEFYVTDESTGLPIAGAEVRLTSAKVPDITATTDSGGRSSITIVTPCTIDYDWTGDEVRCRSDLSCWSLHVVSAGHSRFEVPLDWYVENLKRDHHGVPNVPIVAQVSRTRSGPTSRAVSPRLQSVRTARRGTVTESGKGEP